MKRQVVNRWTPPYRQNPEKACAEYRRRYRILMLARREREKCDTNDEERSRTESDFDRAVEDARIDQALPWEVGQYIAQDEETGPRREPGKIPWLYVAIMIAAGVALVFLACLRWAK